MSPRQFTVPRYRKGIAAAVGFVSALAIAAQTLVDGGVVEGDAAVWVVAIIPLLVTIGVVKLPNEPMP